MNGCATVLRMWKPSVWEVQSKNEWKAESHCPLKDSPLPKFLFLCVRERVCSIADGVCEQVFDGVKALTGKEAHTFDEFAQTAKDHWL